MAETRIAEIYEPLTFNAAVQEKQAELNRFLQSGVMVNDPMLTAMAATGGRTGELPFFAPLSTATDPDIMTDDPTNLATPGDISFKKMIWYLAPLHRSWSTMNLARDLALEDPMAAITNRVAKYWATAFEKRVLASAVGVLTDNDKAGRNIDPRLLPQFKGFMVVTIKSFQGSLQLDRDAAGI